MSNPERSRGQAMVEFAVIGTILLILILGVFQFALIYHAKITLNYAAFETTRAGSLNNARMWAMELAFARAMAPLYTQPYVRMTEGNCTSTYVFEQKDPGTTVADSAADDNVDRDLNKGFSLDQIKCARQRVRDMIEAGLVRITLVNPNENSFLDHGIVPAKNRIPNDSLMYRSAQPKLTSQQSIHDANLIKVNVGFCYKLIVPMVDRIIGRMIALGPNALEPDNFGPPRAGSFAASCATETQADGTPRYGIPLFSEAIMRMQSDAILDRFCGGQCAAGS